MKQENGMQQIQEMVENVKDGVLLKFPLLGTTMSKLKFQPFTKSDFELSAKFAGVAYTNGKEIRYNPNFMQSLTFDERVFIFAHEIMHVAFEHLPRSVGRDADCWNIATDAVINQMLKNANLSIPKGSVNIPWANGKSAEETYEILCKKEEEHKKNENTEKDHQNEKDTQGRKDNEQTRDNVKPKKQKKSDPQKSNDVKNGQGKPDPQKANDDPNGQGNSKPSNDGQNDETEQSFEDLMKKYSKTLKKYHSAWGSSANDSKNQNQGNQEETPTVPNDVEKKFERENQDYKKKLAERIRENLNEKKYRIQRVGIGDGGEAYESFGKVGVAKEVVSWKKILKKELEKNEDRWSYRRANQANDFQARIDSVEVLDMAETEVMLDVSGSISDEFLKEFLRQLKPLLKYSKIKIGFFADRAIKPSLEIKTSRDIDNLRISRPGFGTDMDAAVKAFSKSKHVNKIVFTDGWGTNEEENGKVIWIVFENKEFKPCCGKVVYVDGKQLAQTGSKTNDDEFGF